MRTDSGFFREYWQQLAALLAIFLILVSAILVYRFYFSRLEPATFTPIKHVIVIMKENHSFDNYFGTFPGAAGIPSGTKLPDGHGGYVTPHWLDSNYTVDLPHSRETMLQDYDGGLNDGFAKSAESAGTGRGNYSVGYFDNREIPDYWSLASRFVLADHYFHSIFGPTIPNRLYSIAGQSGGLLSNTIPSGGLDFPTIFDQLQMSGISWSYYSTPNPFSPPLPLNFKYLSSDPRMVARLLPLSQLDADIRAGNIPAVIFVDPSQTPKVSEHPPDDITVGEAWTMQIISEIMNGPQWQDTAIFLNWDESGGYFDHMPPPQVDGLGYGFRVPLIVISPYAKSGVVNHEIMDHTSILKFIDRNWNLSPLTPRVANANDTFSCFTFP